MPCVGFIVQACGIIRDLSPGLLQICAVRKLFAPFALKLMAIYFKEADFFFLPLAFERLKKTKKLGGASAPTKGFRLND